PRGSHPAVCSRRPHRQNLRTTALSRAGSPPPDVRLPHGHVTSSSRVRHTATVLRSPPPTVRPSHPAAPSRKQSRPPLPHKAGGLPVNVFRKPAAVAVAAVALAVVPATAAAHDGTHPFKTCSEAYAAGYANIPKGDDHYGKHLDRDSDGIGCDQPPADFVPH